MIRGVICAATAAALAGVLVVGCTTDLDGSDDAGGSDAPDGTSAAAEPGRYSALPEPCDSVEKETLRSMLPGGDAEAYEGEQMATYDSGRRGGCTWHVPQETTTRQLEVDFKRVISYDPETSDDDQADLDFQEMADEAGEADDGTATVLDDVGDDAYLTEQPTGEDTGVGTEVTVAFRNANVIVSVTYTVATTIADDPPDSARLQTRTHAVAQQLAEDLEG